MPSCWLRWPTPSPWSSLTGRSRRVLCNPSDQEDPSMLFNVGFPARASVAAPSECVIGRGREKPAQALADKAWCPVPISLSCGGSRSLAL